MERDVVTTEVSPGTERRKSPRYRYSAPITVRAANAPEAPGMTVEISQGGMSAVIGAVLNLGDTVELEPVGGGVTTAVVRRSFGKIYGFEFLNLSSQQHEKIKATCTMLPLYRSKTLDLWNR
jgi:c-di-GMP-binding flagellar brake protein YcgR